MTASTVHSRSLVLSFEQAMEACAPFEVAPKLAVACSGGADSLSLTLLAHEWATVRGGKAIALIVDHGLRVESGEEAGQVAQWLAVRGIECQILTIQAGAISDSGKQASAREVRYQLLEAYCQHHHILHLLTGHHADDQAETVAFRAMRSSGAAGLAGMAMVRELEQCRLLRPLLHVPKEECVEYLESISQPYVTDLSNASIEYTRNAVRKQLGEADELDELLNEAADGFGDARQSYERLVAHHLVRCVQLSASGISRVEMAYCAALPEPLQRQMMQQLVVCVSGTSVPPRSEKLLALQGKFSADSVRNGERFTALGCVFESAGEQMLCYREVAAAKRSGVVVLADGARWDGRYVWHGAAINGVTIAPLGEAGLKQCKPLLSRAQQKQLNAMPYLARLSLPALWHLDEWLAVPHMEWWSDAAMAQSLRDAGKLVFAPYNSLAGHGFFGRICAVK